MAQYRQKGIWLWPVFVLGLLLLPLQTQAADSEGLQDVQSNRMGEMGITATIVLDELTFLDWFIGHAMAGSSLSDESEKAATKAYLAGVKASQQKNYSKSLEHYQRALLLIERMEDENFKARKKADTEFNIGQDLRHLNRCEEALQYYAEALQYYAEAQAYTNESKTYYYQGWCQNILQRHTEAVTSFDKCISIGKSVGLSPDVIKACHKFQKEALAGARNQASGDYDPDEPEPGDHDDRHPDDYDPEGRYDERHPDERGPDGDYDEPYPDERGPDGDYDERYPDERGPDGDYDERYPDDRGPDGDYDERYPDERGPDGDYDERYPDDQGPE